MKLSHLPLLCGAALLAGCPDDEPKPGDTDTEVTGETETDHSDSPHDSDTEPPDTEDTVVVDTEDSDTLVLVPTDEPETDTLETDDTESGPVLPSNLLMITEVADGPDVAHDGVRWVEICNPNDVAVDLDGWFLGVVNQGTLQPAAIATLPHYLLQPGDAWVIGRSQNDSPLYEEVFAGDPGATLPDQWEPTVLIGNGDDAYVLVYQGAQVDIFGDPLGPPTPWNYEEKVALRDLSVTGPRVPWLASEWTIGSDFTQISPGRCNPDDTGSTVVIDTSDDTFQFAHDTFDTSTVGDSGEPKVTVGMADLGTGDLVIDEFMAGPDSCEYLAFRFVGASFDPVPDKIDLNGLVISDEDGNAYTVSTTNVFWLGDEILAIPAPTAGTHCYGIPSYVSVTYGGFLLDDDAQGGDRIRLSYNGVLIDEVDYRQWAVDDGVAWSLDGNIEDAAANDDAGNWCPAPFPIPGSPSDFGSPGMGNPFCPVVDTGETDSDGDTEIVIGHTDETDTLVPVETAVPTKTVDELDVGDLVITEFMSNPNQTSCQREGEYLEIRNRSGGPVDLSGLVIDVGGTTGSVETSAELLDAGQFAIVYAGVESDHCFYSSRFSAPDLQVWTFDPDVDLPESGGVVSLKNATVTIDAVDTTSWNPTSVVGSAWSLTAGVTDAAGNDTQANWCSNGAPVGPSNLGTPGVQYPCPTP